MQTENISRGKEIATTILQQLGGNKFTRTVGAKDFLWSEVTEHNPYVFIKFSFMANSTGLNRCRVSYIEATDYYRVKFYRQRILKGLPTIDRENETDMVGAEDLQELFTKTTGLYTSLGTMGR